MVGRQVIYRIERIWKNDVFVTWQQTDPKYFQHIVLLLNSMGLLEYQSDYLCLFMIAAAVSVIPFTIGGLGARELVFVWGQEFLQIDTERAVAYSILFFCITLFSGLVGWGFSWKIDEKATS